MLQCKQHVRSSKRESKKSSLDVILSSPSVIRSSLGALTPPPPNGDSIDAPFTVQYTAAGNPRPCTLSNNMDTIIHMVKTEILPYRSCISRTHLVKALLVFMYFHSSLVPAFATPLESITVEAVWLIKVKISVYSLIYIISNS